MNDNQKAYTAEFKIRYGGDKTSIVEKHFDEFTDALNACQKFRKSAGVNYGGAVIRENDWLNELYQSDAAGNEFFTAYHEREDYGEIILAARGNSRNLTRI